MPQRKDTRKPQQLQFLSENYPRLSISAISRQLGIGTRRIVKMLIELGLKQPTGRNGKPHLWTANRPDKPQYWVYYRDGRRYYIHKERWEAVNGPVPENMLLRCCTSDTTNTSPENWRLVTREENVRLNRNQEKAAAACRKTWAKARRWAEMGLKLPSCKYSPNLNSPYLKKKKRKQQKHEQERI